VLLANDQRAPLERLSQIVRPVADSLREKRFLVERVADFVDEIGETSPPMSGLLHE
jgi:hypothetical protein